MSGGGRSTGQAMVEFALVSMLLIVIVAGIMDFSYLFFGRSAAYQATRVAARFAATHPTAWSNAPAPGRATIEGQLLLTGVPAKLVNDDQHVTISYFVPGPGPATLCGQWSAQQNQFVPQPGQSQNSCVAAGHLVQVQATYTYLFITPMLRLSKGSVTISTQAAVLEEA